MLLLLLSLYPYNRLLSEKEEKERLTSKNFDQLDERVKQSEKMVALYKLVALFF